jgi:hypothetical protein
MLGSAQLIWRWWAIGQQQNQFFNSFPDVIKPD